jgi:hypothetical protein
MKNRIIKICELGQPQSIIHREDEQISELIKTTDLLEELNEQLLIPVFVGSYADKKENKLGMCHTCGDFKCVDSFCKG